MVTFKLMYNFEKHLFNSIPTFPPNLKWEKNKNKKTNELAIKVPTPYPNRGHILYDWQKCRQRGKIMPGQGEWRGKNS